jgi:membrane protease YdiL (CAAX protease family)
VSLQARRERLLPDTPHWLYAAPGQLRAPWRLVCFGASLFLAQGIAESLFGPLFNWVSAVVGEPIAAYPYTTLLGLFAATAVALRMVDDAPWSAVGLGDGAWRIRALVGGKLLGLCAILTTSGGLYALGLMRFDAVALLDGSAPTAAAWFGTAVRATLLLAPAALWEELLFRGYLWHVARHAAGTRVALWSTSVAFALLHLGNPGVTLRTLTLVCIAGVCLGVIRARFDSLPAAWFAHLVWNWTMAAVLHVEVSGLSFATPLYRAVLEGPTWLTGGSWGPEGGAIAGLIMTGGLLLFEWPRRFDLLLPHMRRERSASMAAIAMRS